jgi:putative type I restriction enzyme specificity protein
MKREQEIFPYIAQLLNGAEVEWKPLGKVTEVKTGQSVNKNIIADNAGEYPVINSGREPLGFINVWNTDNDPIGITSRGAGVGSVTWQEGKYFRGNLNYSVSIKDVSTLNTRFLYHLLLQMQPEIHALCTFEGIPALNAVNLKKLQIPLPSLFVQQEIVRILDKFTQLEAELEAELDCRKRQYEYYRDKLLTSDEKQVEWKTLGEVGTFVRGKGLQKKDLIASGVPAIHYGQIYTYYGVYAYKTKSFVSEDFAQKARKAQCGDLVIATTSENDEDVCKAVAWLGDEKVVVSSDACFYTHTMNPKYVAYYFQTEHFQKQKKAFITGTKVKRVNADDLAKITIPVPPIEEQERITGILDKFDTLVNSISEGLPREIELRRKQYEYYREKLLSFPKN